MTVAGFGSSAGPEGPALQPAIRLTAEWVAGEAPHPRKYYRLTPAGRGRLKNMCREFQVFTTKIDRLVKAAGRDA